jgi:hypothetical protein
MAEQLTRSQRAAAAIKNIETLGKEIKKPSSVKVASGKASPTPIQASGLPTPVAGTSFIQILMYIVAGILLIGLILLAVDQWITPVFQRKPGGAGYIPIPGTDSTQIYWTNPTNISNITVGPVPPAENGATQRLNTSVIEGQLSYSLTLDVIINDEFPQNLGTLTQRTFFILGPSLASPTLTVSLDNNVNTIYVTSYDTTRHVQTAVIENVPIHSPFRVGIVKSPYALEAYLNGKLAMTINLRSSTINPTGGDTIFAPSNILHTPPSSQGTGAFSGGTNNAVPLSRGIQVMNLRIFGYVAAPSEMIARMSDLASFKQFHPPLPSS